MLRFAPHPDGRALRLLALAAHCDDVEIGAGATILRLLRDHPGSQLCVVIAASTPERANEASRAAEHLAELANAGLQLYIGDLDENVLPDHTGTVRDQILEFARPFEPDVVFSPHGQDRHQDHRVMSDAVHQLFRDQPIFEYEIAKYDGDLHTPNVYAPVSEADASSKVDLLFAHYVSQHGRTWFDQEAFMALLRLRGIECNTRYAEGFHVRKLRI